MTTSGCDTNVPRARYRAVGRAAPGVQIAMLAGLLSQAACGATVTFTATNASPHLRGERSPADVITFTASRPKRPYVEIGLLEAEEGLTGADSTPELVALLRQHAARRGCDGLVITSQRSRTQTVGYDAAPRDYTIVTGACIVFVRARSRSVARSGIGR